MTLHTHTQLQSKIK